MANIGIFATPDNEEALQKYMTLFSVSEELFAAQLGYDNYKDALVEGSTWVHSFLKENGLVPEDVMIVFMTVAGMRWNLLDKENNNEPTRHTESGSTY